jgi:hypothetical protein
MTVESGERVVRRNDLAAPGWRFPNEVRTMTLWTSGRLLLLAVIVTVLSAFGIEAAQDGPSFTATQHLISALNEAGLDSIASIDPTEPGAFVAALHIKGGQLLVVRARHPSVEALSVRLAARQFRDIYMDLQATPTPQGKVFVMDSGADGLPSDSEQPSNVDILYEDGTRQVMFNGARAQKLSADQYRHQLQDADAKYRRLLNVLVAAIGRQSSAVKPLSTI